MRARSVCGRSCLVSSSQNRCMDTWGKQSKYILAKAINPHASPPPIAIKHVPRVTKNTERRRSNCLGKLKLKKKHTHPTLLESLTSITHILPLSLAIKYRTAIHDEACRGNLTWPYAETLYVLNTRETPSTARNLKERFVSQNSGAFRAPLPCYQKTDAQGL